MTPTTGTGDVCMECLREGIITELTERMVVKPTSEGNNRCERERFCPRCLLLARMRGEAARRRRDGLCAAEGCTSYRMEEGCFCRRCWEEIEALEAAYWQRGGNRESDRCALIRFVGWGVVVMLWALAIREGLK